MPSTLPNAEPHRYGIQSCSFAGAQPISAWLANIFAECWGKRLIAALDAIDDSVYFNPAPQPPGTQKRSSPVFTVVAAWPRRFPLHDRKFNPRVSSPSSVDAGVLVLMRCGSISAPARPRQMTESRWTAGN
ncbi:hypothetical protein KCP73_11245 [Salmonella enterica subsp. enterica]|nr:hypothetical protein KCP73_11245 [Salmonella enterica subsp. enterica]